MELIIVFIFLFILTGGLSKFRDNSPATHEETTKSVLEGFEHTQYYKDQIEFSRELDKTLKK